MTTQNIPTQSSPLGDSLLENYRYMLGQYLKPQQFKVLLLGLLISGSIGLQLVNPQILRRFIDTIAGGITPGQRGTDLIFIGVLFFSVAVIQQILGVGIVYVGTNLSWLATNNLRFDLAKHCLGLDMSFQNKRTPGEMISRIDNDSAALSRFFAQFLVRMVSQSLLLVGILVLLFFEDWRVGIALTIFSVVAIFIMWRLKNIAVPHWWAWSEASANFNSFLEERLNGVEDIRAAGAKAYVMDKFYKLARKFMKIALKAGLMSNIIMNSTQVLFAVGNGIGLAVGAWLFLNESITIGTVYIIFHYSAMLTGPIQSLANEAQSLQAAGGSVERIVAFLKVENSLTSPRQGNSVAPNAEFSSAPLEVIFQNVSFRYTSGEDVDVVQNGSENGRLSPADEEANVLQDISFHLQPGRSLGLLGRTGSGKTTLARLIFRLYDPISGTIKIGDGQKLTELSHLPLPQLRGQIGLVTQNVELFNASVYDNLTFFDPSISEDKILEVLRDLGLWKWYTALPNGLNTMISSGGKELSAGQAQLLAFARVFLQNPKIVILDEASSRLDPATEGLIEKAIEQLIKGRTAIIIAHRLTTIQHVDEIMIIDNGRIQEHDTRHSLLEDPTSRFNVLLNTGLTAQTENIPAPKV
ncbi:MAG: ABC transporter ATP-binding protein [Chloroflexota bacterium]